MRLKLVDYDAMRKAFNEKFKETQQLIQDGETHLDNLAEGFLEADRVIYSLPTIDAVPVVRCRDCKHRKTDECHRYRIEIVTWQNDELMPEWDEIEHDFTKDEGFCDRGERDG